MYLGREFEEFFLAWSMLEKGFLPHAGGWAEQWHVWIQAFEVIGAAVARVQREHRERLEAEYNDGSADR